MTKKRRCVSLAAPVCWAGCGRLCARLQPNTPLLSRHSPQADRLLLLVLPALLLILLLPLHYCRNGEDLRQQQEQAYQQHGAAPPPRSPSVPALPHLAAAHRPPPTPRCFCCACPLQEDATSTAVAM